MNVRLPDVLDDSVLWKHEHHMVLGYAHGCKCSLPDLRIIFWLWTAGKFDHDLGSCLCAQILVLVSK